jgi:hypothetical protein
MRQASLKGHSHENDFEIITYDNTSLTFKIARPIAKIF